MMIENEQPKFYNVRIYYQTQCNQTRIVKALSEESALANARKEFEEQNESWIKQGGNPKTIESIEIVK